MIERVQRSYPILNRVTNRYLTEFNGELRESPERFEIWDIYPMPDEMREVSEKEDNLGNNLSRRPYIAEVRGKVWRIGFTENSPPIKIYFNSFNSDGLPNNDNYMSIPQLNHYLNIRAETELFGLSYEIRLFITTLYFCIDGEDPVCKDYFVNEVNSQILDDLALKYLCFKDNPHSVCVDLCNKSTDNGRQCDSVLRDICSDPDYADNNKELCACHRSPRYYRDYIYQLRDKINSLDDRYSAIKSILNILDYDPANPHCFHPDCMKAQYYGNNPRPCSDITLCFQGIDLVAGNLNDTQLRLLNRCLLDRIENSQIPFPDPIPSPDPTPDPSPDRPNNGQTNRPGNGQTNRPGNGQTNRPGNGNGRPIPDPGNRPSSGKNSKDSTYLYIGISAVGLGLLLLIIILFSTIKKKKR